MKHQIIFFFTIFSLAKCNEAPDTDTKVISSLNTTAKSQSDGNYCQVATEDSEGVFKILYKMREIIRPSRELQPNNCLKTATSCSFLECCSSDDPKEAKGKCILKDWVIPSAAGLVTALLLALLICCCCCCCCKKRNKDYSLNSIN